MLVRHEARKTPCELIVREHAAEDPALAAEGAAAPAKAECPHCGRRFSAYTHMRRHVRHNCRVFAALDAPVIPAPRAVDGGAPGQDVAPQTIERFDARLEGLTTQFSARLAGLESAVVELTRRCAQLRVEIEGPPPGPG